MKDKFGVVSLPAVELLEEMRDDINSHLHTIHYELERYKRHQIEELNSIILWHVPMVKGEGG